MMQKLNTPLYLFLVLVIVGLAIRYFAGIDSMLWEIWSSVDVASAVALAALAFFAYQQMLREDDEIQIILDINGVQYDTGLCILRKDCIRSEVLGVLGMIQRDPTSRFTLTSLQNPNFLTKLHRLQKGKERILSIETTPEEIKQFKVKS